MAIRLREVDGELVALCAAETKLVSEDVYLDDRQHYALSCKFARDHLKNYPDSDMWNDSINDALAKTQIIS